MSTQKRLSSSLTMLTECAIMLALSFALSCAKLFEMPMGGSVTVASMLPVMLISIKYGIGPGLATSFLYSLTQLLQAIASANVFPYCETPGTLALCVLFDYIVPFTLLGLAGLFHKSKLTKNTELNIYLGIIGVVVLRFFCHFVTGVAIWGQWAPDGMGKYLYSFLYNGGFLSLDFLICIVCAVLMFRKAELRRLVNID
ncbi:MAG: energy-coupled thiamine transporter ThiT [Clostridia bacterium]|nr:energy-coupled thiamine transporter ThiT [Clostridia bacterium]